MVQKDSAVLDAPVAWDDKWLVELVATHAAKKTANDNAKPPSREVGRFGFENVACIDTTTAQSTYKIDSAQNLGLAWILSSTELT